MDSQGNDRGVFYLDMSDLIGIATRMLNSEPLIRDHGLLESALALTETERVRLSWLSVNVFYGYNGWTLKVSQDEYVRLVQQIAGGLLRDIPKIADRFG